jgi:polyhydroxyalkanoate synthesis regulator protein
MLLRRRNTSADGAHPMPTASKPIPILVKRYGRNRLYDTERGCYVSHDQLREWTSQGILFSIVDTETGSDVTSMLLN